MFGDPKAQIPVPTPMAQLTTTAGAMASTPICATLDPAEINVGSNDEADTDKTVCHELGHTLGLTHGPGGGDGGADDCMISGERPNTHIKYERFSTHHKEHINDWF